MPSTVFELAKRELICPPSFLPDSVQYEVITGSVAYGCSSDTSDMDIVGFCIPNKDMIFPHLKGEIEGFGRQKQKFEQYQQHGVSDPSALSGKGRVYDLTIYSIVKYFQLVMENNPNMLDTLFCPQRCILTMTTVAGMVREKRKMFLHRGAWHKHKGYAFSQLNKIKNRTPDSDSKRGKVVAEFGYDTKYALHLVRLMSNVEQILIEGDLDIEKDREMLKAIRRGEWSLEQVQSYFDSKERDLESLYTSSKLPHSPDEPSVKNLLLDCLEQHFGSLSGVVVREDEVLRKMQEISDICTSLKVKGFIQ